MAALPLLGVHSFAAPAAAAVAVAPAAAASAAAAPARGVLAAQAVNGAPLSPGDLYRLKLGESNRETPALIALMQKLAQCGDAASELDKIRGNEPMYLCNEIFADSVRHSLSTENDHRAIRISLTYFDEIHAKNNRLFIGSPVSEVVSKTATKFGRWFHSEINALSRHFGNVVKSKLFAVGMNVAAPLASESLTDLILQISHDRQPEGGAQTPELNKLMKKIWGLYQDRFDESQTNDGLRDIVSECTPDNLRALRDLFAEVVRSAGETNEQRAATIASNADLEAEAKRQRVNIGQFIDIVTSFIRGEYFRYVAHLENDIKVVLKSKLISISRIV